MSFDPWGAPEPGGGDPWGVQHREWGGHQGDGDTPEGQWASVLQQAQDGSRVST